MADTTIIEAYTRFLEEVSKIIIQPNTKYSVCVTINLPKKGGSCGYEELSDIMQDQKYYINEFLETIEGTVIEQGRYEGIHIDSQIFSLKKQKLFNEKPTLEEKLEQYNPNGYVTKELTAQAVRSFPEYEDPREALAVYLGFAA